MLAPATVPMTAPFSLRLVDAQAAVSSAMVTSTVALSARAVAPDECVLLM
jgi:hypothetical protein